MIGRSVSDRRVRDTVRVRSAGARLWVFCSVILLCAACAIAQDCDATPASHLPSSYQASSNKVAAPGSAAPPTHSLSTPQAQILVRTQEVMVPVTVTDKQGRLVMDLAQKDFHVFDNGVGQKIMRWDLDGDPLEVALVIETSAHIRMMAPVIHEMGSLFTENVMALDGEAAVITYDSAVDVRQPFTQDHDAVEKAIRSVEFDTPEMKLYDAMATAVQMLATRPPARRRILLIVGESQDSSSHAELKSVIHDAVLNNITIYSVGPSSTAADLRYGAIGGRRHKSAAIAAAEGHPSCFDRRSSERSLGRSAL